MIRRLTSHIEHLVWTVEEVYIHVHVDINRGPVYPYDPLHRYFANDDDDGDEVEIEDVPGGVRTNLEKTARNGIAQILNQVPVLAVTDKIDSIRKSFDQNTGSVMYSNITLDRRSLSDSICYCKTGDIWYATSNGPWISFI